MKKLILVFTILFCLQYLHALTITDGRLYGRETYVVKWIDNDGQERMMELTKSSSKYYAGTSSHITYYNGSEFVNITPFTIDSVTMDSTKILSAVIDGSFGGLVHHGALDLILSGDFKLIYQGAHHAIFQLKVNVDKTPETITYTFMDGLDYFQWSLTADARNGMRMADSRAPYCSMNWDGKTDFSEADGVEYAARRYFSQPKYNGPYTFGGLADIPYCREWDNGKEVGYVQTQTYDQQMAGILWSEYIPSSGITFPDEQRPNLDFQMNYWEQKKKITWGMPYGFMNADGPWPSRGGTKEGWGQYSLSIIFDGLEEDGVLRVRDENRAIHNNNIIVSTALGELIKEGNVGTANSKKQLLSPQGFDHNYRLWRIKADDNKAIIKITTRTAVLTNPVFIISNVNNSSVRLMYNGIKLVAEKDYYLSYLSDQKEVWITLLKEVYGKNNIISIK
jgi:hypothetical protein